MEQLPRQRSLASSEGCCSLQETRTVLDSIWTRVVMAVACVAVAKGMLQVLDDGNNVSDQKRLPDHSSSAKLGSSAH